MCEGDKPCWVMPELTLEEAKALELHIAELIRKAESEMTEVNPLHIFIGGPDDGVRRKINHDGSPKEIKVVRSGGALYRFNGTVNEEGFREMVCVDEGEDSQRLDS